MALILKVNNVDKTSNVEWSTLEKQDVLTKEPDRLEFKIKNYGSKTYRPILGDEVTLFDGATKIFGGLVVETSEENSSVVKYFTVLCKDYQQIMDRKLVNKTYTDMPVNSIIADINSLYLTGFTTTNAIATDVIKKIVFNDEQPSKCIQKLADMIGDCDWYVDYDKDIHFFKEFAIAAPYNLDDTSGNYTFGTLKISRNINQIRNKIIVRGGDKVSTLLTNTYVADGQQRTFVAKPGLQSLTIQKSTDGGANYSTLTIGQDGVDDPASKDVLYNPNNGFIIFPNATKPSAGHFVKWSGNQVYPIKIIRSDVSSITTYGEYQYVIRDATIKSEDQAIQRAKAEIKKYGARANEGYFRTIKPGLKSGQSITVNSTILGIVNETFKITRVIMSARTPDTFDYEVQVLASENVGIIDVLGKLMVTNPAEQFQIEENEVLVQAFGYTEEPEIDEDTWRINPWGVNVLPIWVAGPWFPVDGNDRKRMAKTDHKVMLT